VTVAGIADGHGREGHFVAQLIRKKALEFLFENGRKLVGKGLLEQLVKYINAEVEDSGLGVSTSGAAFVACLVLKDTIFCAYLGDCRAMAVYEDGRCAWLTEDHNLGRAD
jgi:serine/threonine protein phosphatase PrpC